MKKVSFSSKPSAEATSRLSPDRWVNDHDATTESTKRLTIDVPQSLHTRVKSQCALQGLQMADVVREMLERRFPAEEGRLSLPETRKDDPS
ncbi:MAG TPA: plasmid partition protein ParG [Pirellulales bacterium]|jgi:hypothetical protein